MPSAQLEHVFFFPPQLQFSIMTFDQMLKKLPALTPAQRRELVNRALDIDDDDDFLTPEQEAMIDQRFKAHHDAPETSIPLDEMMIKLQNRPRK
jgi:hypothetical protein